MNSRNDKSTPVVVISTAATSRDYAYQMHREMLKRIKKRNLSMTKNKD